MPQPFLSREPPLPEERRLAAAHRELLQALEETQRLAQLYFSASLDASTRHRDGYLDALARQARAEAGFVEAKMAFGRARLTRG